jgi:methylated-DNA-[protein]-cysteine S-methyltransferase
MNEIESLLHRGPAAGEDADGAARAAAGRFSERAAAQGRADLAYATIDSPLGPLLLAGTPRGLLTVAYLDPGDEPALLERLAARVSPRIVHAPGALDVARRELDEYFAARRHAFDLALDWRLAGPFQRRVLAATARIPYGSVSDYGTISTRAGSPRGARAAGNALGANPIAIVVPCHRVLRHGGQLGGYAGGPDRKRALLALEGAIA